MLYKLIKYFKKIYKEKPKNIKKNGRKKIYSETQIALICVIMVLKKIYSFNGIIKYLKDEKTICKLLELENIPDRTTLSRRAKVIHKKLKEIITFLGLFYCRMFKNALLISSLDSSLLRSAGPLWHKKDRNKGLIPDNLRNVDRDSKWGYSKTKDWIQGYKMHCNVVYNKNISLIPFPINGVVTTANISDFDKGRTLYSKLSDNVIIQLGDKGYDKDDFFKELWKKGVLFVTPIKNEKKIKEGLRLLRYFYYRLLLKLKLFITRNISIEPFNGRMKNLFPIDPLPMIGKKKAKVIVLSSIICYQVVVLDNIRSHREIGFIKEILNKV